MKESKKEETKDSLISLIFPHRRPIGSPSFKKSTRSIDWSGKNKTKTGTGFAGKVECFFFLKMSRFLNCSLISSHSSWVSFSKQLPWGKGRSETEGADKTFFFQQKIENRSASFFSLLLLPYFSVISVKNEARIDSGAGLFHFHWKKTRYNEKIKRRRKEKEQEWDDIDFNKQQHNRGDCAQQKPSEWTFLRRPPP